LLEYIVTSNELAQLPILQLVGLSKASTNYLDQLIQQAKKKTQLWKHEGLLEQKKRTHEEYLKLHAE
jgi:hypothetical protein